MLGHGDLFLFFISDYEPPYVRWFSTASARDKLVSHGAVPLRWEVPRNSSGASCHVIPLTSISRRVHVVPAFETGTAKVARDTFYVNPFVH